MAATLLITSAPLADDNHAGISNAGIGAALTPSTAPIEETVAADDVSGAKVARFSSSLDLEALEERAPYVPVTTVAALRDELSSLSLMNQTQLREYRERSALIGTIGIVNVSRSLNVREEPDGDAQIVGKIYQNSGVIIRNYFGDEGEWTYVSSGSVSGWVVSKYIVTGELADSLYETMRPRVATTVCECTAYEKATSDSNKAVELDKGEGFVVLGYENDFVKVQLTAASDGYIDSEYIAVTEGLFAGKSLVDEEKIQDAVDLLTETRRIAAEKKQAEEEAAKEAARIAAQKKKAREEAKKNSSGSSGSSSKSSSSGVGNTDSEGWTYLGKFRVTFYCVNCNTPKGSRSTYSGAKAKEWHTCAVKSSQISMGTEVKVSGFGTFVAEDTGVGYNQIDLFVSPDECDGLYYRDVWVRK
ncbi:MAG: SH3 domain-containing protein [Lachnospiraceae bacterium]|nr:SH3 domain-containing protein [Lachnospiraceae bacterium]